MFHCSHCGGEHYYQNECLTDPSKHGEGLVGYKLHTNVKAIKEKIVNKKPPFNVEGALCDVLSLLEDEGPLEMADIPQDILEWWKNHQSEEKEKLKKQALAKLSAKEKRALGLK